METQQVQLVQSNYFNKYDFNKNPFTQQYCVNLFKFLKEKRKEKKLRKGFRKFLIYEDHSINKVNFTLGVGNRKHSYKLGVFDRNT